MSYIDEAGKSMLDDEDYDLLEILGYNPDEMTNKEISQVLTDHEAYQDAARERIE